MEISLKKTTAAVIALGLSGLASASGYAPACTKYDVSIPCQVSGWDLGFEALVAEPMNQELFYQSVSGSPTVRHQIDPKFKFGFRLEGSYHFGHGNDATLNWTRFDQDYTGAIASTLTGLDARTSFKYDLVNLELAQRFDVGPRFDLRTYFGPSFMRVDQFIDSTTSTSSPVSFTRSASKFHGGGFRGGFDGLYQLTSGFSLAMHGSSGLLVGDVESRNFTVSTTGVVAGPTVTTNIDTRTVVPFGEAKMGLNYATGSSWGNVSLEGGYFLSGAFNSIHHVLASSTLPNAVSVSDFGLHGFYFTGKVDTSVA